MNAPQTGFSRMVAISSVLAEAERLDLVTERDDLLNGTGKGTQPLSRLAPHSWNGYTPTAIRVWQDASRSIDTLGDRVKWADVLLEAVFKAVSEDDEAGLRKALVRTAAVTVQWIEAIDQRAVDA